VAKKRVIVKRLASIQNLGSMDVLCTHKTGTLTEAKIKLEQHVDPQGQLSDRVLEPGYLSSFFETGLKSPLDEAILSHENVDVSAQKKRDRRSTVRFRTAMTRNWSSPALRPSSIRPRRAPVRRWLRSPRVA